ncbi:hypothetical protein QYF36_015892 [Acer negundo]|nr:hypothetical protein QYF36_014657 [Acer negundo]KAK4838720.1 hypothetical protein QYF36_015892 [Acer negundo]
MEEARRNLGEQVKAPSVTKTMTESSESDKVTLGSSEVERMKLGNEAHEVGSSSGAIHEEPLKGRHRLEVETQAALRVAQGDRRKILKSEKMVNARVEDNLRAEREGKIVDYKKKVYNQSSILELRGKKGSDEVAQIVTSSSVSTETVSQSSLGSSVDWSLPVYCPQ